LLSGSVPSVFSPVPRSVSSDLLSGDALRLSATVYCNDCCFSDRFDGCGACDTSNACLEDAGADHKTDLL
jgi:hypothetical protein